MKENEYQCYGCGEVFEKESTDEEMMEEFKKNWGEEVSIESLKIVCDDCYKRLMALIQN